MLTCGSCGSQNANYYYHLGVASVRCDDCGADLPPGLDMRNDDWKKGYESGNCSTCHRMSFHRMAGVSLECDCPSYRERIEAEQRECEAAMRKSMSNHA